ncbi:hypothetical protein CDL12_18170 [Handroanthus impetiginosus]|uniref:Uncharacterized protein n=1 Tax=Handroanthus impetiginosus TaxID=429701 RepID=A0A2G9GVD4_9LAMI|nr:hypothetical protein CDL12_18170 [Handroanthus impetiginosus]
MTTKCCEEKAVIVAVYTERVPLSHNHNHHQYNYHNVHGRRRIEGYNRKAELLEYARHLRASAQQHQTSHMIKPISTVNQTVATPKKPRSSSHPPTCLGKWEFLIPTFLRSNNDKKKQKDCVSPANKMKALVKSIEVQKKTDFLSKLLRKLQKRW